MYSRYGMVLYELFAQKLPYGEITSTALVGVAVLQSNLPPVPATLPPFLHPLMKACWKAEPNLQPHFDAIIAAIQTAS